MILNKTQINKFNRMMLGLGAPVEIDGQGYSKIDFSNMVDFADRDFEKLTDRQIWFVVKTLGKYKNTQLTSYKADLEETLKHYAQITDKSVVKCLGVNNDIMRITWGWNPKVNEALKGKFDKSQYRWEKSQSGWVLNVNLSYVPVVINEFENLGLNCEHMKTTTIPVTQTNAVVATTVILNVQRSDDIDTLEIKSAYNKELVNVYHTIPSMRWNSKRKLWTVPIEDAAQLYDTLPSCVNKTALREWADLVKSWKTSYELVNVNNYKLKFTPYKFQPEDAKKLLNMRLGLNANEVGCGKTFEMILIGESIPKKKLVICPATLRLNWEREIKMVNPDAQVHIQYSDQPFKTVDGWNIIGYPSLTKFQSQLEAEKFFVVMADEAHYIQAVNNYGKPDSQRAIAVLRIAATAAYVFPITGTPKTSRNKNLYNILRMIRHPLTKGFGAFQNYGKLYCEGQRTRWGWDYNGNSRDSELNKYLQSVMVRHLKKDVLPNLRKQRQPIPVKIDLRKYTQLIDEYLEKRKNSDGEELVILNKAKQSVAIQKAQHSIEFAKDLIESGEKVVIVTCYTEVVNKVMKAFKNCLKLVGGMSDKAKQATIDAFQTGEAPVIVINVVAGGVGVTLTAASNMIINDLPWTTGEIKQAEGRIWRGGQTKTAMIYFMSAIGCPMDESLIDTIVYKSQTINDAVDGGLGDNLDLRKLLEQTL